MNILVQDQNLVPIKLIDAYKSAIWTERFREAGDFEIVTSVDALDYIQKGYYLTRPDSDRVMIVEGFQIETDSETGNWLIVNGRSIESLLDRRIVWDMTTLDSKLDYAIKRLITENVISPGIADRTIPNIAYKESEDSYIDSLYITAQFTGDNLYDTICAICETFDIGWKMVLNANDKFEISIFPGTDRSYEQTSNPYVVFSPSFDNIINSQYVESDKELKDVALVAGEETGDTRRRQIVGSNSGIERRELYVDARDLQSDSQQMYDAENPNRKDNFANGSSTMKYVSANGCRSIWVKINPNSEYNVTRTCPQGWHLDLATSVDEPTVGGAITNLVNADEYGTYLSESGTIISGPNDRYLNITLNWSSDSEATFENSTVDFTIRGQIPDADYEAMLVQRGQEKLAECKAILSFDGEVDYKQMYKYGEDFFMGDICELENEYRISCKVRVMELVTSDDENGYSIYPTFTSYGGNNS